MKHHQLFKKGMIVFLINIIGVSISILLNVLLAKEMNQIDYGFYAFLISFFTLLSVLCQFGFPTLLVKNLPLYFAGNKIGLFLGLVIYTLALSFILAFLISLVLYFNDVFISEIFSLSKSIYKPSVFIVPTISFLMIGSAILRAIDKPIYGVLHQALIRPLIVLLIMLFFIYKDEVITRELVLNSYLFSAFFCCILMFCYIYVFIFKNNDTSSIVFENKSWIKESFPLLFLSSVAVLTDNLPILTLTHVLGLEEVASYRISALGGSVISFIILSLTTVVLPRLSLYYKNNKFSEIEQLSKQCAKWGMSISFILFLIYLLFANKVVLFVLGEDYSEVGSVLTLFALSRALMAGLGIPGAILSMSGFGGEVGKYWFYTILVSVAFGTIISGYIGFQGMVMSILVGEVLLNIRLRKLVHNKMKINTGIYPMLLKRSL
ncbi:oligosaccharide flippase family protein [Colwellia sp. BRX8-7]|uniref:oligosaccharide flippase family protein n=1 Tax=Colwellia sp. BRX8-7 TaxID=2759833 RepID=UPI0015F6E653|nr:oligosaccharide flippase family protein [Colwellia sp. BRX8-7]MBA6335659.1 oligosaccharide flippase family protein [Colwellia sp. BRX8-7]